MPSAVTPITMGTTAIAATPTLLFTVPPAGTYTVTTLRTLHITNRTSLTRYLTAWIIPSGASLVDAYLIAHELPVQPHKTRTYSVVDNLAPASEIWLQGDAAGLSARASGAGVLIT